MDEILNLIKPEKLGHRLTVKLAAGPTSELECADPATFYSSPIDTEKAWQEEEESSTFDSFVLSYVMPGWNLGRGFVAQVPQTSPHQRGLAKSIFVEQKRLQMLEQKKQVHDGLATTKKFFQDIKNFEL